MANPGCCRTRGWTVALLLVQLGLGASPLVGQPNRPPVDFLDERVPIPEAERYREADYIQSGVGLSFGVDKRLSYLSGRYPEAVERFEESLKQFRYKSEIWVFLARSYFYMKEPEKARQTLERAEAVMPDLRQQLWQPLTEGLEWQIRQRADQLQTQVEYYTPSPGDLLALFRLCRFLSDSARAAGVIRAAEEKGLRMEDLATMVSGASQRSYRAEAARWQALADTLRSELNSSGVAAPPSLVVPDSVDAQLVEATRLLQLRVDFYLTNAKEYRALFDNYLRLGQSERAREVVTSLTQEIARVGFLAETAANAPEQERFKREVAVLAKLRQELETALQTQGLPP